MRPSLLLSLIVCFAGAGTAAAQSVNTGVHATCTTNTSGIVQC